MTVADIQARLQRLSPRTVDAGLVAAVALAMTLTISVAEEDGARSPNALAYVLGLVVAALVLVRRQWPLGALIASVGVLFVYYGLDYEAFSPAVPLAVTAYYAAAAGQIVPAGMLLAGVVLVSVGYQTVGEDTSLASVIGTGTLADAALLAAVLLLGEAVRSRRALAAEIRARLARETARRVAEERLRIARDLHDVIAHTIAGVNVQAAVAADALDDAPGEARASLDAIREQSGEALAELKATVGVLRDEGGDAPRAPAPGLADLDGLVRTATGAGVRVDVSVDGDARALPGAVDLTAYRIVQESLTNVVRHARASRASVRVRYDADAVVVQVEDDGRGAQANGETRPARPTSTGHSTTAPPSVAGSGIPGGFGLAGMRERAATVGGTFEAGEGPGGGFRVEARLPT